MSQKKNSTFFEQIYESTTHLWNKFVPVSVDEFVDRITSGSKETEVDRVEINVESKYEGNEPAYLVSYRAFQDDHVLLRARENFSCVECKDAHLKAEGEIPEEVKKMVWKRTEEKFKKVYEALVESGIPVEINIPSSRDTDVISE